MSDQDWKSNLTQLVDAQSLEDRERESRQAAEQKALIEAKHREIDDAVKSVFDFLCARYTANREFRLWLLETIGNVDIPVDQSQLSHERVGELRNEEELSVRWRIPHPQERWKTVYTSHRIAQILVYKNDAQNASVYFRNPPGFFMRDPTGYSGSCTNEDDVGKAVLNYITGNKPSG